MSKNILILSFAIIIGSLILGGFFYAIQINKQQSIEKEAQLKREFEKEARDEMEIKLLQQKEQTTAEFESCLSIADENYQDQWFRECKSRGELSARCVLIREMSIEEYIKENNTADGDNFKALEDLLKERDDCSCRLPLDNADRINASRDKEKDLCFKRYPQ